MYYITSYMMYAYTCMQQFMTQNVYRMEKTIIVIFSCCSPFVYFVFVHMKSCRITILVC